jgi:predicted dehydrogenase
MIALVISFGAAGKRHAAILNKFGIEVRVVTLQKKELIPYISYKSISAAFSDCDYGYCVISSVTSRHFDDLDEVLKFNPNILVLVEKPIFNLLHMSAEVDKYRNVYVGYNMRFLSHISNLRLLLNNQSIKKASFYISTYLPSWRSGLDYKKRYSIQKQLGGGVLRELSHELDLSILLLG